MSSKTFILIICLILVSCGGAKFQYKDVVSVERGFYKGYVGVIQNTGFSRNSYLVDLYTTLNGHFVSSRVIKGKYLKLIRHSNVVL